jgi:hypothetical protein
MPEGREAGGAPRRALTAPSTAACCPRVMAGDKNLLCQLRHFIVGHHDVDCRVPLAQVRDLLGHASILTTERYDNQRLEAVQAAVERLEGGKTFDPKTEAKDSLSRIFQDPTGQSFAEREDPAKESATSH